MDLPNGIVSALTDATFEAWYTINTAQAWSRVFDFGSTTGGELNAPGGGSNGQDFIFYAPMRRTDIATQHQSVLETTIRCPSAVRREPSRAAFPIWTPSLRT